jgi:hypothetical protein
MNAYAGSVLRKELNIVRHVAVSRRATLRHGVAEGEGWSATPVTVTKVD